jgi:hypothetical protein
MFHFVIYNKDTIMLDGRKYEIKSLPELLGAIQSHNL